MAKNPARNPYKIRSPETWDLIRSRYTRGETANSLAEELDVTEDAIRNRARKQGWTKRAYAAATEGHSRAPHATPCVTRGAAASSSALAASTPTSPRDVAEQAVAAAGRAIAEGRFAEAERLAKMAEILSRLTGGAGGGSASSAGAWRSEGAAHHRGADPADEPEFPPKPEPFMTPGETKRSPYQVEMLRLDVEERYERLARRLSGKAPAPDLLVVAYGLDDAYTFEDAP